MQRWQHSQTDASEAGGLDADGDGQLDFYADDDGDGIPNNVDADSTGGQDLDGDGIDDSADVDFVLGDDSDGDGIVDAFDTDPLGFGFVSVIPGQVLTEDQLPDSDGDGSPDLTSPELGAALDNVQILTGLSGNGAGATGPLMPAVLSLLALIGLGSRRGRKSTER